MKAGNDILKQVARRDGMTVPDGYFADFAARMAASLEPTDFEKSADSVAASAPRPKNIWQRVRPYAYMAAMFAGVWCMLKMFTMISDPSQISLESNPTIADALTNEIFVNEYILDDIDQYDILDELYEEGYDIDALADSMMIYDQTFDSTIPLPSDLHNTTMMQ